MATVWQSEWQSGKLYLSPARRALLEQSHMREQAAVFFAGRYGFKTKSFAELSSQDLFSPVFLKRRPRFNPARTLTFQDGECATVKRPWSSLRFNTWLQGSGSQDLKYHWCINSRWLCRQPSSRYRLGSLSATRCRDRGNNEERMMSA